MNNRILAVSAAVLSLTSASYAQTVLIGGIGFEQLNNDAVTFGPDWPSGTVGLLGSGTGFYTDLGGDVSLNPGFTSRVSMYWDGTNQASGWDGTANLATAGSVGGFANFDPTGELVNTPFRQPGGDPGHFLKGVDSEGAPNDFMGFGWAQDRAVALRLGASGGNRVSFVLNSAGHQLETLQFVGFGNTATDGASIQFGYWNGSSVVNVGSAVSFSGPAVALRTVDFTSVSAALADQSVTIVATITGDTNDVIALDNFQFLGSAANVIPEPSTYAAILGAMTVGIALLRRRNRLAVA